jgi:8-oxo-dGTP diphosphatase
VSEALIPEKIPFVGVGCIVIRDGQLLLVRNQRGLWSTPGGHLDFGESPEVCAARETREETGVSVTNLQFVAITNDVLTDVGKHYVTIWMRGEADGASTQIGDTAEIKELGWFRPDALPAPLQLYFQNLLEGRCWPRTASVFPE